MPLALITLTVAQLFDLGTFVRMIATHGAAAEANPLVRFVLIDDGLPTLAVAKLAVLSLVVAIVVVLAGRSEGPGHARLAASVVAIAIATGILGGWSNAAVIL
jgi:hypothetical protein